MQYLKQIVNAVNTQVATKFTDVRFNGKELNGICILANDGERTRPLLTDNYDDNRWVGPDDTFPLRIYHRTITISRADVPGKSYGNNGNTTKQETANMSLFAYANRNLVRLTPEELEAAIVSGMPSAIANATLANLKLNACVIVPTNSDVDSARVFVSEFRPQNYELTPNGLFIRINYNIVSTYRTPCFDLCDC